MVYARWRTNWGPLALVLGTWLFSSYLLVQFVHAYGVDVPHYDEWENVPAVAGEQPITLKWLWSQHNEHRIVLPRLVYLALARLTHGDFRAGMVFNIAVISLEALALVLVARKIRGRTEFSDAFFPLLLQTWGQAENLYWSFQVQFICSAALSVAFLAFSARSARLGSRAAVGLGVCAILLPLVGGNGLALVPAASVSVLVAGFGEWRRGAARRRRALVLWAMAIAALALTAFYFVDYERPAKHPTSHSMQATYDAALQFLSVGFGQSAQLLWPDSKPLVVGVLVAAVGMLAWVFFFRRSERARAFRLLLVIGGMVCLALGIGWARNALSGDAMFAPRYPTLAAPMWCAVYLAWETLGEGQLRRFAQAALFLAAASVSVQNYEMGKQIAEGFRANKQSIVDDIRAGVPLAEVVRRHHVFTYYGSEAVLKERMQMLHARGIGVFRSLKP